MCKLRTGRVQLTRQLTRTLLIVALGLAPLHALSAAPVENLLHALASYIRSPNYECDWRAWHVKDAKHLATLHQKLASDVIVEWGAGAQATLVSGAVAQASVETYLAGPPTSSVRLNGSPAVNVGDRLSISLVDHAGVRWPVFCGYVFLSAATATRGLDVHAVQPRPDGAGVQREFREMNAADVVSALAHDLGLQSYMQNLGELKPLITQQEGDFDFLRRLARDSGADLYLDANNRITMYETTFTPPPWPPAPSGMANAPQRTRYWYDMKDSEIVEAVANELGRSVDLEIESTQETHDEILQNRETDYEFVYRLAERNEFGIHFEPDRWVMNHDNVKRPATQPAPNRSTLPGRILVDVAARNRLPIDLRVGPERPLTWPALRVTEPALLFGTLYRARYTLVPDRKTLRITASVAPGDFTDHLPLRVTFAATSATPQFRRNFVGVNGLMVQPDRTAEESITAQIKRRTPRAVSRQKPSVIARPKIDPALARPTTVSLSIASPGPVASAFEQALTALSAAHQDDAVSRFLLSVARDYQRTLVHIYRRLPDGQARLESIAGGAI